MSSESITESASVKVVLSILSLSVKYGIPAVTNAIAAMSDKNTITLEDVQNLEMKFKDPKSYFPGYKE